MMKKRKDSGRNSIFLTWMTKYLKGDPINQDGEYRIFMDAIDIFYGDHVLFLRCLVGHEDVDIQYAIEHMGMELRRKA